MIHPIEDRSYQILSAQFDFSGYDRLEEAVVKRVIHATADFELAESLSFASNALSAGVKAIQLQHPVVCDVEMVRAGITAYPTSCFLSRVSPSESGLPTRSYSAMIMAAESFPKDAVFVVGCAPTALEAIVELSSKDWFEPALVIGLPVGFVGASEIKERLRSSPLPFITNRGNKGGSPAASAAFNAIVHLAKGSDDNAQ